MATKSRSKAPRRQRGSLDTNMVKAMSHPVRMQLMTRLDGKVASPRELAAALELPIPNVSYHVRILRELGMIELVKTQRSRGSIEHFYRGLERPFITGNVWSDIPRAARKAVSGVVLADIAADVNAAVEKGTFDARDDRHLSRVPLVLDEEGWQEVRALLAATLDEILAVQARASGRMTTAAGDGSSIDAEIAMMLFEQAKKRRKR